MNDSFISNIEENDNNADLSLIEQISQIELEHEQYKEEIKMLRNENIQLKHQIEDLRIECKHYSKTIKNQNNLINFYKENRAILGNDSDKKKLEVALRELNELRAKEGKEEANMEKMLEDPKNKLYDEIKEYKKELEIKNKENIELKNQLDNCEINFQNELKAQTEYLNNMIEEYKKNIEDMKEQKINVVKDYKNQIEKLEMELGNYKIQLANVNFDMEKKVIIYKNYVNKLQSKLEGLGFKFKGKIYDDNDINKDIKVSLRQAKTMV